jgi:SAM-dependent methyltransferase
MGQIEKALPTREDGMWIPLSAGLRRDGRAKECRVIKQQPFATLDRGDRFTLKCVTRACVGGGGYAFKEGRLIFDVQERLTRLASKGGAVYFLDAGAGEGAGLVEAEGISPNIRAYGLALGSPNPANGIARDRWTWGYFECTIFKERGTGRGIFDVIQSHWALEHAANRAKALENMLNSLAKGGTLFSVPSWGHNAPLYETLRDQDFRIEADDYVETITRLGRNAADLGAFYDRAGPINTVPIVGCKRPDAAHSGEGLSLLFRE